MGDQNHSEKHQETKAWFTTTQWTVVLQAKDGDPSKAATALNTLCQTYRSPIYAYLRHQAHTPADAEDLTHDFFAHLLNLDFLSHLQHREGKFRSFLLKFLKHFLSDARDKARAGKRGGGRIHVSLDGLEAEVRDTMEPVDGLTPDQVYDRHWAQTMMERALNRLRMEYATDGKTAWYEQLRDLQPGQHGEASYAEIGVRLGVAEGTVKSAVHRLRKRHREMLREEIAQTVTRSEEIDEEIRHLLTVLSR